MKRRLAWLGAWLLATALLVVCARTIEWTRAMDVLSTARIGWLSAAVLFNTTILVCWAAFWRAILPASEAPIRYSRMFEIVATASSLMNTVPFGGGHASSIVVLMRRGGTTQRGALSVLALDQLGEGVTKVSLFLLVAMLLPLPVWMKAGVTTASIVVGAWFIALLVASRWARELEILRRWRRALTALACVITMKAVEGLALVAIQQSHAYDAWALRWLRGDERAPSFDGVEFRAVETAVLNALTDADPELRGEAEGVNRVTEYQHELVADLFDDPSLVGDDDLPDDPVETVDDLDGGFIALEIGERAEERQIDEHDRCDLAPRWCVRIVRIEVRDGVRDRRFSEVAAQET